MINSIDCIYACTFLGHHDPDHNKVHGDSKFNHT